MLIENLDEKTVLEMTVEEIQERRLGKEAWRLMMEHSSGSADNNRARRTASYETVIAMGQRKVYS